MRNNLSITAPVAPGLLAALLVAASLAGGILREARADVVHLKNGNHVEGEVAPGSQPGHVKVTMDRGLEMEFPEKDVQQVEAKKSPAREFDEKLRVIAQDDVDSLLMLAEWARERKLRSREEKVYSRILEIDPNEPVARRELGYSVFKNRWVKESELRTKHGLVQFRGDWVAPEEKERRLRDELRKEITELFRSVDSDNRYIREYSVRKLMEYRDPRAGSVLLGFLNDPRETVRVVSVQVLATLLPAAGESMVKAPAPGGAVAASGKTAAQGGPRKGGAPSGKGTAGGQRRDTLDEEVARALHARVLEEESPTVRSSVAVALQRIRPRRFFELAMETLASSDNPLHRDRAAEGILFALEKGWMEELIRALPRRPPGAGPEVAGSPEVRSILTRVSREDFEYRVADWQAWWLRNQARFQNEG